MLDDVRIRLGDFKKLPGIGKKTVSDAKEYVQNNPEEFGVELDSSGEPIKNEKELLTGAIDIGLSFECEEGIKEAIDAIREYIAENSEYDEGVNDGILKEAIKYPQFKFDLNAAHDDFIKAAEQSMEKYDHFSMQVDAIRAIARDRVIEIGKRSIATRDSKETLNYSRFDEIFDELTEEVIENLLEAKKYSTMPTDNELIGMLKEGNSIKDIVDKYKSFVPDEVKVRKDFYFDLERKLEKLDADIEPDEFDFLG